VHPLEVSLRIGCFRRLGCVLGARVDDGQWKMAEGEK